MTASWKASPLIFASTTSPGIPARDEQTGLPNELGPDKPVERRVHIWFEFSHTIARSGFRSPDTSPDATATVPTQPVARLVVLKLVPVFCM